MTSGYWGPFSEAGTRCDVGAPRKFFVPEVRQIARTTKSRRAFCKTIDERADALHLNQRMVKTYLAEGMPGKSRDGYHVGSCVRWSRERAADTDVRARKLAAEADNREKAAELKELQILRERGAVID